MFKVGKEWQNLKIILLQVMEAFKICTSIILLNSFKHEIITFCVQRKVVCYGFSKLLRAWRVYRKEQNNTS